MKTSAIVRIVIWSVVALALLGLLLSGLVGKGAGYFSFSFFGYENDERYSVGDGSADAAQIQEIAIDWVDGSVNIVPGTGDRIEFREEYPSNLNKNERMRYLVDGDKLTIRFNTRRNWFSFGRMKNKKLTIEVPQDLQLKKLDVDSVSAELDIAGVTAKDLDFENVSGSYHLKDVKGTRLKLETVSGRIQGENITVDTASVSSMSGSVKLQGSIRYLDGSSVSGKMSLAPGNVISEIDAETVSGDIDLYLSQDTGFHVDYDTVSGDFNAQFDMKHNKGKATYLDGVAEINMETVSGDMTIHKAEKAAEELPAENAEPTGDTIDV